MFNSKYFITLLAFIGCLCSCSNNGSISSSEVPTIKIINDSIVVSTTSDKQYNISINLQKESVVSGQINKTTSYSLLDLARKSKNKNEVALAAVNNNNNISFTIKVGEVIDTLVNYTIEPYYDEETVFSISGQCAPLVSKFSNPSQSVDLKKWLFRKKSYLEDEQVHTLSGIINQLSKTDTTEYITTTSIPIIHNFSGIKYNVKSNIEADHYVLFACSSAKEIEDFVEEIVANDFELCSNSSSGTMSCYRKIDSNGNKCICLIAIKKDWSYKIQPLGLVAIDNIAPSYSSNDSDVSSFSFPNNMKVILPSNKPNVFGFANVAVDHWDGTGLSCACTFIIRFGGDASSVTIHRTGKLAKWLSTKHKKIDLSKLSSPYSITMDLHLEDGDNRIPITISDSRGNTRDTEVNIRAEFVRTNTNDINIDNNINIWD